MKNGRLGKGSRDQEMLEFLGEVEAAVHRTGHSFAYLLSLVICLLVASFVAWAHFTVLDEVTRGQAQVIPSQRIQVIQNLEGGILEDILVGENQIVEKGDVLVRLSNVLASSQFRDVAGKALEHQAALARLEAEVEERAINFSDEVLKADAQIREDQVATYNARKRQLGSEMSVLNSQYEQKMQEIEEMESRRRQLENNLRLAQEQRDIAKPLVQQEVYPKVEYLGLEREVSRLKGEIDALRLGVPRVRESAQELRRRMAQRQAEFKAVAMDEINRRRTEYNSLRQAISAGQDRVTRTDVRSPMRGTVKQISINTIGGVIRPGEPIMEIVPLDDTLLFEAQVRPADIAFLHPGQQAMIRVSAYDFGIYGGLGGVVEQISADTILNEKGESFYKVKLRSRASAISYRGQKLPIIPGMMATVDILTGKKTVLDYLLKPILKAKQNALRER